MAIPASLSALLLVPLIVLGAASPSPMTHAAAAQPPPTYVPPVADAVVVDPFRAPPTPYAAGNRGLDERTTPGSPVVAPADGEVLFAGPVAGALHVTILHGDGLRTTCSFLAAIIVRAGQRVRQGELIGWTGATFHVGVRDRSGTYLDPELLFGRRGAHLVAGPDDAGAPSGGPATRMLDEARALADLVAREHGPPAGDAPVPERQQPVGRGRRVMVI